MQARTDKKYANLNGTQVRIIHSAIEFPLNDILITLIKSHPVLALLAIDAITSDIEYVAKKELFKKENVLDSIDQIRSILKHNYPQNCNQTYAYLDDDPGICKFRLDGVSKRIRTRHPNGDVELKNGRLLKSSQLLMVDDIKDYLIAYEPTGLLNLTTREDDVTPPATREAVHLCIYDVLEEHRNLLLSMPSDLIGFITHYHSKSVQELMEGCNSLTLPVLIKIGVPGLTVLLRNPQALVNLTNKLHISIVDFINLCLTDQAFLLTHHEAILKLCELPGVSWWDLFNMQTDASVLIRFAIPITELIKAKEFTVDELKTLGRSAFIRRMVSLLEKVDFPPAIWLRLPTPALIDLLKFGFNPDLQLALYLRTNTIDANEKARVLIRYGAVINESRNDSIKQLQMLRVYNENFARAQKRKNDCSSIPNFEFMIRFLNLYLDMRSASHCHRSSLFFFRSSIPDSLRGFIDIANRLRIAKKLGNINLADYIDLIKKILEVSAHHGQQHILFQRNDSIGCQVLFALANYLISCLKKNEEWMKEITHLHSLSLDRHHRGIFLGSNFFEILMDTNHPIARYTCKSVYDKLFRGDLKISFENFFEHHVSSTEMERGDGSSNKRSYRLM